MSLRKSLLAAAIVGTLAMPLTAAAEGLGFDSDAIVKAADWDKMETVTVRIGERGEKLIYSPQDVTFKVGQPYKLEMVNIGKSKHYYTAPEFYQAIATRKAQSSDGEIKAPYFKAFEMFPKGGQVDLYFVPVKAGTYEVVCTIDDHRERGMVGTITITE